MKKTSKGGTMFKKLAAIAIIMLMALAICANGAWADEAKMAPANSGDFMSATQGYDANIWYTSIYGDLTDVFGNVTKLRGDLGLKHGWAYGANMNWEFSDKWGADLNFFTESKTAVDQIAPRNYFVNTTFIPAGALTTTKLTLTNVDLLIRYNLARSSEGRFDIGVAPKLTTMDVSITQRPNTAAASTAVYAKNTSVVIPVVGLSGKQRIAERLYLDGKLEGMFWKSQHLVDFKADMRYNFQYPGWYGTLGYRIYDAKVDMKNGMTGKATWNGPFASIRYEF